MTKPGRVREILTDFYFESSHKRREVLKPPPPTRGCITSQQGKKPKADIVKYSISYTYSIILTEPIASSLCQKE